MSHINTLRMKTLRSEIMTAARITSALARALAEEDIQREGNHILILKRPQDGWWNLDNQDELVRLVNTMGISATEEDFIEAIERRTDIVLADRLALMGWKLGPDTRFVSSTRTQDGGHEVVTEKSLVKGDEVIYIRDFPVDRGGVPCLIDGRFEGVCRVWVWPDGRYEVDLSEVYKVIWKHQHEQIEHCVDIELTASGMEQIAICAQVNRAQHG